MRKGQSQQDALPQGPCLLLLPTEVPCSTQNILSSPTPAPINLFNLGAVPCPLPPQMHLLDKVLKSPKPGLEQNKCLRSSLGVDADALQQPQSPHVTEQQPRKLHIPSHVVWPKMPSHIWALLNAKRGLVRAQGIIPE